MGTPNIEWKQCCFFSFCSFVFLLFLLPLIALIVLMVLVLFLWFLWSSYSVLLLHFLVVGLGKARRSAQSAAPSIWPMPSIAAPVATSAEPVKPVKPRRCRSRSAEGPYLVGKWCKTIGKWCKTLGKWCKTLGLHHFGLHYFFGLHQLFHKVPSINLEWHWLHHITSMFWRMIYLTGREIEVPFM